MQELNEILVTLPDGSERRVAAGSPAGAVLADDGSLLAAAVDNLVVNLDYPLVRSAAVRPIRYHNREGNELYRRSLSFLLVTAARVVFPASRMVIGHSLAGGYYFDLVGPDLLDAASLGKLEEEIRRLIAADLPILHKYVSVREAIAIFGQAGRADKVKLLKRNFDHEIELYELNGFPEMPVGPLAPSTGRLGHFELKSYPPGLVLRFPDKRDITRMPPAADQTRLFAVYHESKKWSQILKVQNVGDINEVVARGRFHECVQVAEALHEKKIAFIADRIMANVSRARLIFIAGPSSSGKTTFAKRLSVQLRVNGLQPRAIGLDDYFVDRDLTPKDAKGDFDFEHLHALNLDLLNDHLVRILAGEDVELPRYDFKTGRSVMSGHHLKLGPDDVLVVEGIHGLNPSLTSRITADQKFRIYVSALTQLTIDDHNRIPTTDTRLIRRIVRDHKYRGYSALDTIRRWPSVIRGEARNIFPWQEQADVIFNTALLYELAVLKAFARRSLEQVPPDEPEFAEARRILEFLHLFAEADTAAVPPTSIIREFFGGSSFEY